MKNMKSPIDLATFINSQFEDNFSGITIQDKSYTAQETKDLVYYAYNSPPLLGDNKEIEPFYADKGMNYEEISSKGWSHFIPILTYMAQRKSEEEKIEKSLSRSIEKSHTLEKKVETIQNLKNLSKDTLPEYDEIQKESTEVKNSLQAIEKILYREDSNSSITKIDKNETETPATKKELEFIQKRNDIVDQLNQINSKLNKLISKADMIIDRLHDLKTEIHTQDAIRQEKVIESLEGVEGKEIYAPPIYEEIYHDNTKFLDEKNLEDEAWAQQVANDFQEYYPDEDIEPYVPDDLPSKIDLEKEITQRTNKDIDSSKQNATKKEENTRQKEEPIEPKEEIRTINKPPF